MYRISKLIIDINKYISRSKHAMEQAIESWNTNCKFLYFRDNLWTKKRFKVFFHFLLQIPFICLNIVLTKKFIHLWNYMVRTTTYDLYFSQISDILTKTPNYKYTYTYLSTRTTLISICWKNRRNSEFGKWKFVKPCGEQLIGLHCTK